MVAAPPRRRAQDMGRPPKRAEGNSWEARLARKIQDRRIAANLTQPELADALGTTQGAVSRWERGEHQPSVKQLAQLASLFGCEPGDLTPAIRVR